MSNSFDTWLSDNDIVRLGKVITGELSEDFCTLNEIEELRSLVVQIVDQKYNICGTIQ